MGEFVGCGGAIVSDGWSACLWIDDSDSGYARVTHIHGGGDLGLDYPPHHILNLYGIPLNLKSKQYIIQYNLKILYPFCVKQNGNI